MAKPTAAANRRGAAAGKPRGGTAGRAKVQAKALAVKRAPAAKGAKAKAPARASRRMPPATSAKKARASAPQAKRGTATTSKVSSPRQAARGSPARPVGRPAGRGKHSAAVEQARAAPRASAAKVPRAATAARAARGVRKTIVKKKPATSSGRGQKKDAEVPAQQKRAAKVSSGARKVTGKKEEAATSAAVKKKREQEAAAKAKQQKKREQEEAKAKMAADKKRKKEQETAKAAKAAALAKNQVEEERDVVMEAMRELDALKREAARAQNVAEAKQASGGGRVKQRAAPQMGSNLSVGGRVAPKRAADDSQGRGKGKEKAAPPAREKQLARRESGGASSSKQAGASANGGSYLSRPVAPMELPKGSQDLYAWSKSGSRAKHKSFQLPATGRRIAWSHDEVVNLKKGYEKWGPSWSRMLRDPEFSNGFDKTRTDVQLKDKFRNLEKQGWQENVRGQEEGRGPGRLMLHFRQIRKAKKDRWSAEEEKHLRRGVKEFGTNWTEILQRMPLLGDKRTTVDLKDKWRNIVKAEKNK